MNPQETWTVRPLDSPISGSSEIVGLLAKINRKQALTVIMVSHEEALLREHCNGIVRLFDGELKVKEQLR